MKPSPDRMTLQAALAAGVLGLAGCTTLSPEAQTAALIKQAEAALGSAQLKTLTITGRGTGASVGQAYAPDMPWPQVTLTALSRSLNFETAGFREEFIRSRSEPLGGGALPLMGSGDARGVVLAQQTHAWNVAGVATVSAPHALATRLHDLWTTTPQGAIKAAASLRAQAGERRAFLRRWDTLSFTLPGQFSATLVLEDTGLVSRIESIVANPVLGGLPVVTQFLDYQNHAGLMLPARIVQEQAGHPALDIRVTQAQANEPVEITIPDEVRTATEVVSIDKLADGVWWLGGSTHHSVAVEVATQIVLVELPLHEGRARAVLAAANKLVAGKKAQTVINTHHHFDHSGGLRVAVEEGATIYTSAIAKPYFEAALARPMQPAGHLMPPSSPTPKLVAVQAQAVLGDATRPVEIHELQGSVHARGLLVVWLPREQLLIEADAYTPGLPDAPPPAVPNLNHVNLVQNLERLNLAPKRIVPLHGRMVPAAELYRDAGRALPP